MTPEEKRSLANSGPRWMYEFDLGDGIRTPLLHEELSSIHQTREQMILSSIGEVFPESLSGRKALDVACNEGYFSQVLYHLGATGRAIDIRSENIERARIVQQLCGLATCRLAFQVGDLLANRHPRGTQRRTMIHV